MKINYTYLNVQKSVFADSLMSTYDRKALGIAYGDDAPYISNFITWPDATLETHLSQPRFNEIIHHYITQNNILPVLILWCNKKPNEFKWLINLIENCPYLETVNIFCKPPLTKEEVQKNCIGDVFTSHEFWNEVRMGGFNPYDGFGNYHDGVQEITSPDIWKEPEAIYPYICWYNK